MKTKLVTVVWSKSFLVDVPDDFTDDDVVDCRGMIFEKISNEARNEFNHNDIAITDCQEAVESFSIGDSVYVTHFEGDMFNHDFAGVIVDRSRKYFTVEDGDGACWDCEAFQLSRETKQTS